ncbi:MAG TPA: hypothetical protein VKH42_11750 [Vicinamibacterales bacterium]|nr:hypothetical protein [Vicinamibacterales bacterium]
MANERRRRERRRQERRQFPSAALDVTRLEHENLYDVVEEVLRTLQRVEFQLIGHGRRLEALERDIESMVKRKGA